MSSGSGRLSYLPCFKRAFEDIFLKNKENQFK